MHKQRKEVNMSKGRFGKHGGQYIPETLMNEIHKLEEAYEHYKNDPEFIQELDTLNREYAGRPSLLYYAEKMTKALGGAKIYFKREDLNHTKECGCGCSCNTMLSGSGLCDQSGLAHFLSKKCLTKYIVDLM